ncbi:MAG: EAL domain-containing protein [Actinomycetota bacterium]|nr:EAL domain-containing protein [Actinomycetota bacterium]
MRNEQEHPAATDLSEQEVQVRLKATWMGVWITVIVSLGAAAYALLTWNSGSNRDLILVVTTLGLVSAPLIARLPIERIIRSRHRELFFIGWTSADIAFIAFTAALDGGTRSPFILLLVLPFLYGALSYPLWVTCLIGVVEMLAFIAVAVVAGGGFAYSGFGAFALLCVAMLGSWEARNQARRRIELAETADALARSEQTSRLRAAQQREVADFGQLALQGVSIEDLQQEAVELFERVLNSDIAAVVRLNQDSSEFRMVAQTGLATELMPSAPLRAGIDSQAGHTLVSGDPAVVRDWSEETRFTQTQAMKEQGMRSGVSVLIKATGEPWGVLGMQAREVRDYSTEDVSFMQAVAHVLSNAIERNASEERNRHEALHDPLTGLPNRNLFLDRLEHALLQSSRRSSSVAVLFLDLDQFKLVNDSLGHAAGDELLAAVAPRLQQALRPGDTVARFGGDEFAVLAEDVSNERDAIRVAERIAEGLTRPFALRQREHFASASIGIAIGAGTEQPEELIRDADAALYRAKDRGRGGYEIFDEVMRSRVIDQMQTEDDLRRALQRGELELHYQPIIRLADESIVMFEALLRWHHPERGLLPPAAFIPVAEESRLIVSIGRWAIEEACRRAADWQALDPDGEPIGVAVNLSARQLTDPELLRSTRGAVERSGIDPSTLYLELTETTLMEEIDALEESLASLRALGARLILDDFGTGFSSLGYLKRLPLAGIKLDRAFVENLTAGGEDAAIVYAVTEMAISLGLEVCAEGVESIKQLDVVRGLGCSHAQGFHLGRPVPAGEIHHLLRAAAPTATGGDRLKKS